MAITNPDALIGSTVTGSDGDKLGKVEDIYYDNETGKPEWAAVKSGIFGGHVSLLPLVNATQHDDGLTAPYSKAQVKDAPHHDPDKELSIDDEADLFRHYGIPYTGETVTAQPEAAQSSPRAQGPSQASGDDAMTRSEEELRVGTRSMETGRARLRKHIVTETVSQTVPVSHDEVHIEREAITDANRDTAMAGPEITEAEHEVVLYAEEPVVQKDVVAVERVRLAKETVTGEETVSADLRKEQIEEDTDLRDRPGKP
jgi:uncharacterized protein (TIGR02271 family)